MTSLPWGSGPAQLATLREARAVRMNDTCWCRSGRKHKKCHWRREHSVPLKLHEADEIKRSLLFPRGARCQFHGAAGACMSPAIKSHLVGKSAALRPIAEDEHVYSVAASVSLLHKELLALRGTSRASVFPGFCAEHDRSLFSHVDNPTGPLDARAATLLSYRAVTKELWTLQQNLTFGLRSKEFLDRGRPLEEQVAIQNHLNLQAHHHAMGLGDLRPRKRRLEEALDVAGGGAPLQWRSFDLGVLLPVVGCGGYCCAVDFEGQGCTWHGGDPHTSSQVALLLHAVVPWQGTTHVVFGWIPDDAFALACNQVSDSFANLSLAQQQRSAVLFLFEVSENLFARMSWWDSLHQPVKSYLERRLRYGGSNDGHKNDCLLDRGVDLRL